MDFYYDIKVLPDPEASSPVLISNLMAKLHRALVGLNIVSIGISFPLYGKSLGEKLRLHGSQNELKKLMQTDWLKGLRDYCNVGECLRVPTNCQYRRVYRVQAKSVANKRKRSIAKGWLTQEQAEVSISVEQQKLLKLPFVQLKSSSTGQQIKLFLKQSEINKEPVIGDFNSYGLSKVATVPWF